MKKIFILPILIAPIVAHATNPVGPSAVGQGETPVIATANAPYAIAGAETGDTTNVVSASYVKGAYNDAIAAVNKVNADEQDKLVNMESTPHAISNNVVSSSQLTGVGFALGVTNTTDIKTDILTIVSQDLGTNPDNTLPTTGAVLNLITDSAIAVNSHIENVNGDKQDKLTGYSNYNHGEVSTSLYQADTGLGPAIMNEYNVVAADNELKNYIPSVSGVASFIKGANDTQRVSAVTTWGDDSHPTKLQLTTASN